MAGLREFTRLSERLLARLGKQAFLRGATICRVHIEHGVEMQGDQGEAVFERVVATMLKSLAPRKGDALVVSVDGLGAPLADAETYTVDSPAFADNGYTVRVVVR